MEFLRYLYTQTRLKSFLKPLKYLYYIYKFKTLKDEAFIKQHYKSVFGVYPNLNNPQTLNEKMQWLKLNDRTPLHTQCADKYCSREYITDKVGSQYLVPLVFETKVVKKIIESNLPDYPVVIKTNHGSSNVTIVRDKKVINYKKLQNDLNWELRQNYYYITREWQYKNMRPRILVEKLLLCENGKIPNDYKIHCFHGEPKIVYVSIDREGQNKRNIYSADWKPLRFTWAPKGKDVANLRYREISPPLNYNDMLDIARKLSKEFKYIRVDLYNVDGKIYCGEMTFHHGSGMDLISPPIWDKKLGDMLNLIEITI